MLTVFLFKQFHTFLSHRFYFLYANTYKIFDLKGSASMVKQPFPLSMKVTYKLLFPVLQLQRLILTRQLFSYCLIQDY